MPHANPEVSRTQENQHVLHNNTAIVPEPKPEMVRTNTPPPPSTLTMRTLALNAVEAIHGIRPLEQLSRYVTGEVFERLMLQRTLRLDRKAVYRDERRIVPLPGRVVSSMPHPDKIHAVVVMHTGERSFAVVLRLEKLESRWRATELAIL